MVYNWDMTELQKLPIDSSKTETIKILKAENKAVKMLAILARNGDYFSVLRRISDNSKSRQ